MITLLYTIVNLFLYYFLALAVFYALYPEYFVTKPYYVVVDCSSSLSYGRTLVDKNYVYGLDPTVEFGKSL